MEGGAPGGGGDMEVCWAVQFYLLSSNYCLQYGPQQKMVLLWKCKKYNNNKSLWNLVRHTTHLIHLSFFFPSCPVSLWCITHTQMRQRRFSFHTRLFFLLWKSEIMHAEIKEVYNVKGNIYPHIESSLLLIGAKRKSGETICELGIARLELISLLY